MTAISCASPVEEISRPATPAVAGGPWQASAKARLISVRRDRGFLGSRIHPDKIAPERSAADRVRPKSKSRVARDRVVRSAMQPPHRGRARRFRPPLAANHSSLLPSSASAPRGITEGFAGQLPVRSALSCLAQCGVKDFLRLARIAQHQETKAIKLRKILFSIRHARWSPKKLRALYACRVTQAILPACIRFVNEIACISSFARFSTVALLPRHFPCC